ncbi:ALF repeat-containing protein [Streptomyces sp. NPDC045456]|uniref:ALF repeat-containing protein n=1 Tax=Streptomyces sp. NPDC045456 TaxID=3155254 RepID=UPI0033F88E36
MLVQDMKKQARLTAFLAAAAVAPAVLFASPALAAEAPATANSAPDQGAQTEPDASAKKPADTSSMKEDLLTVARMLDGNPGRALAREARKALMGPREGLRQFLETGQYEARDEDNRVAILRSIAGKSTDSSVYKAAAKALEGTPQDRVRFLKEGLALATEADNRVRAVQISSIGGPAVRAAADEALWAGPEALQHFLDVGQYEARAKDEAAAKKAEEEKAAKDKAAKEKAAKDKAAEDEAAKGGGKNVTPAVDSKPAGGHGTTGSGTASGTAVTSTGSDSSTSGSSLAATGVSPVTPWAAGGAAVAVAAGAGLMVAGRRRAAAERG